MEVDFSDVKRLVDEVLAVEVVYVNDCRDYFKCPFCSCSEETYLGKTISMSELKHEDGCVYLLAKKIKFEHKNQVYKEVRENL